MDLIINIFIKIYIYILMTDYLHFTDISTNNLSVGNLDIRNKVLSKINYLRYTLVANPAALVDGHMAITRTDSNDDYTITSVTFSAKTLDNVGMLDWFRKFYSNPSSSGNNATNVNQPPNYVKPYHSTDSLMGYMILKKNINNYQSPTIAMHIDKVSAINGGDGEPFTITLAVSQIKPYGNSSTVSFSIDDIISVDIYPSFGPTPIGMPYKVSSVHADGLNAETRGKICFGFKDYSSISNIWRDASVTALNSLVSSANYTLQRQRFINTICLTMEDENQLNYLGHASTAQTTDGENGGWSGVGGQNHYSYINYLYGGYASPVGSSYTGATIQGQHGLLLVKTNRFIAYYNILEIFDPVIPSAPKRRIYFRVNRTGEEGSLITVGQHLRFESEEKVYIQFVPRFLDPQVTLNSTALAENVIRTDTKTQQTLTSGISNSNKSGLSMLASSIVFGTDTISDGVSASGTKSGITFSDGSRMTKLSDATGQKGAKGEIGVTGAKGEASSVAGPAGAKGATGTKGDNGEKGITGAGGNHGGLSHRFKFSTTETTDTVVAAQKIRLIHRSDSGNHGTQIATAIGNVNNGQNKITVLDANEPIDANIVIGLYVNSSVFPKGTTVTGVVRESEPGTPSFIIVSQGATGNATGTTIRFHSELLGGSQNAATQIAISNTNLDSRTVTTLLRTLDESNSNIRGHFTIQKENDSSVFINFVLNGINTEETNQTILKTSTISSSSTNPFSADDNIVVSFTRTGDKGQKGDTGTKGQKGEVGIQGIQGIQGITGAAGSNGSNGAKGQKGEVGIQGNPGSNGSNGSNGSKGQKGEVGIQGITGAIGGGNWRTFDFETAVQETVDVGKLNIKKAWSSIKATDKGLQINISQTDNTSPTKRDVAYWIQSFTNYGVPSDYGILQISQTDKPENRLTGKVTNLAFNQNNSYSVVTVDIIDINSITSNGIDNNREVIVSFTPNGAKGASGSNGSNGAKGQKGAVGIQGITGAAGSNGSNGINGAKGQKGEVGIQGITLSLIHI